MAELESPVPATASTSVITTGYTFAVDGTGSNGVTYWSVVLDDGTPRTGGNAGSNLLFQRFADNGTLIDTPLSLTRSTGAINFLASPTVPTPPPGDASNRIANTAFVTNAVGTGGGTGSIIGPTGPAGPAGVAGPTGPTGAAGTPGAAGPAGAIGPTGATGAVGAAGAAGGVGSAGPTGATGAVGAASTVPGPTGATGVAGPAGAAGATGQGYNWRGAWSGVTAYSSYDSVSSAGSSYVCILANTNQAPPNATYWSLMAQVGAQGAIGATGATGAVGTAGGVGPAGPTGATGATGTAGQGVPVGGAAGTVLAKNTATNFDTLWRADVVSFNTRTGAVTLTTADITGAGGAPIASPTFTGTPTLPTGTIGVTQTAGNSTTALATTAFVATSFAPLASPTFTDAVNIKASASTTPQIQFLNSAGTGMGGIYFDTSALETIITQHAAGTQLYLDNGGNFVYLNGTGGAYKLGGGSWTATSDARIKTVHDDYQQGLEEVLGLRPVIYSYKGNDARTLDGDSPQAAAATAGRRFIGLVAQDVEESFPEMVSRREGFIDGKLVSDLRDLDNSSLIYALVNAIKDLAERLAAVEEKLNG